MVRFLLAVVAFGLWCNALPAVDVKSCKQPGGPTGPGHATLTFQADGSVIDVVLDHGRYAGTAVGACIIERMRQIHVFPFEGKPIRVGKSFVIN